MPRLNGKGPQNEGPLSGRGLGRCRSDNNSTGESKLNDQLKKVDPDNSAPPTNPVDQEMVFGRGQGGQPRGGGGQGLGRGRKSGGRGQGRGFNQ